MKPINYDISIHDIELGGAFTYQGTVAIELEVRKDTKEIVLNALELKIHNAHIESQGQCSDLAASLSITPTDPCVGGSNNVASDITCDEMSQRATLAFPEDISASESPKALLVISFAGTMNYIMAGFYRSKYKPAVPPAASVAKDDEFHYMFSTQFESCDARRAFPCFDEPNLKATFDFAIEIPEDQVALSNMNEKGVTKSKNGLKVVAFDRTPIMSTYVSGPSRLLLRPGLNSASFSHGHLATLSMSKTSPNGSTAANRSRSGCTPPGV